MILAFTDRVCFAGVYDTVFKCKGGETFVLRLDCRSEPIILQLFGCYAEHPLIDADMYVRIAYHDGKLLGAALMETIVQMQLTPPKILCFTDAEVEAMQPRQPSPQGCNPEIVIARLSLQEDQQNHEVVSYAVASKAQNVVESAAGNTHPLLASSDHPRLVVQPPPTMPQQPPLSQAARGILQDLGYTNGLIDALEMNRRAFPASYLIVDNSGSMATADGRRILPQWNGTMKFATCTRWKEMQETFDYHSQLAAVLHSPTTYRLLNDPGAVTGSQTFRVAHRSESIAHDLAVAQSVIMNAQPVGVTPLAQHIDAIRTEIQQMDPVLRATGGKVAIVLTTDGLPTDARGYSNKTVQQQFVDTLRSLEDMPVWIVVRLCTDADDVVRYWNDLEDQLDLAIKVLVRIVSDRPLRCFFFLFFFF
jgi:hypothetical protein